LGRTEVLEILDQADVLAISSAWEGFPKTISEAALCALPVVCTPVGSLPAFLGQTGMGAVSRGFSAADFGDLLHELDNDPQRLTRMRAASAAQVPTLHPANQARSVLAALGDDEAESVGASPDSRTG
jgi:glycosyltransferase involved in cell wall biosynthesis